VTDAADRDRLIQAIPNFRDIVAAYARHDGLCSAPGTGAAPPRQAVIARGGWLRSGT
jgi:hypothetical protein